MTSSSDVRQAPGNPAGNHPNTSMIPSIEQLEARYRERTAILGIVGMGYVGLPLMLAAPAHRRSIAPHLRIGQLVVLESTTWPGTTIEIVKPILERSGLRSGEEFFLAFSPEREDPGNSRFLYTNDPEGRWSRCRRGARVGQRALRFNCRPRYRKFRRPKRRRQLSSPKIYFAQSILLS